MKGMYFEFARLSIRLLLAIYHNQVFGAVASRDLERDAQAWLERHQ
jgi:hypothetical protein